MLFNDALEKNEKVQIREWMYNLLEKNHIVEKLLGKLFSLQLEGGKALFGYFLPLFFQETSLLPLFCINIRNNEQKRVIFIAFSTFFLENFDFKFQSGLRFI